MQEHIYFSKKKISFLKLVSYQFFSVISFLNFLLIEYYKHKLHNMFPKHEAEIACIWVSACIKYKQIKRVVNVRNQQLCLVEIFYFVDQANIY